jgi:two-component sensor histidine kinase
LSLNEQNTLKHNIEVFQRNLKMNLIRRLNLITTALVAALCLFNYWNELPYFYSYFSETLIGVIFILVLHRYRKYFVYKIIAAFILSIDTLIISFFLFSVKTRFHFMEGLWIVLIALIAFLIIGKIFGSIFLLINCLVYSYYFYSDFAHTIELEKAFSTQSILAMSIKLTLIICLICFIMSKYKQVKDFALLCVDEANKNIQLKKTIIVKQNHELNQLLFEVHSRVKENLQLIVSLFNIQINKANSKEAQKVLLEAKNRIMTMEISHQNTYFQGEAIHLTLKYYLQQIITTTIHNHSLENTPPKLNIHISETEFQKENLMYIGLIVSELVSNSLKHAFNLNKPSHEISLSLSPLSSKKIQMYYGDNGNWKENKNETTGLSLIETFTQQLDGQFERKTTKGGTAYQFYFNLSPTDAKNR